MGSKLQQYYDLVGQKGGLQAKMRLAMQTTVPSSKAASEPDSPELLARFHKAAEEIVGEPLPKL